MSHDTQPKTFANVYCHFRFNDHFTGLWSYIVVQTTSECAAVLEVAKTDGKNLIFKKTCG